MKTRYEIEDLEWVVINKTTRYAIAFFLLRSDAEDFISKHGGNYEIIKIVPKWSIIS